MISLRRRPVLDRIDFDGLENLRPRPTFFPRLEAGGSHGGVRPAVHHSDYRNGVVCGPSQVLQLQRCVLDDNRGRLLTLCLICDSVSEL